MIESKVKTKLTKVFLAKFLYQLFSILRQCPQFSFSFEV
ncbi:unnamed protein product [Arabidopsis halleri]